MTVILKTPEDIAKMRIAGQLAAEVLEMLDEHVRPGITTEELDRLAHDYIVNVQQAIPAPLNYKGYPKSICTSLNHVVCHGIPNDKPLKSGDIMNVDITVINDGYHGDTSTGRDWAISARSSRSMPRSTASRWFANTAATASARASTKSRRWCTTVAPARASNCRPG